MGRRIRRTNRRSNLRRVRKNTMKRKSMKRRNTLKRRNNKRNTMRRKNSRRNFRWMRGGMQAAAAPAEPESTLRAETGSTTEPEVQDRPESVMPLEPAAPTEPSLDTFDLDTFDVKGINLVRFGKKTDGKKKLVEIGSKPLLKANMDKQNIEELLSGASGVYVPAELKKQDDNEPSSNFRSTDARISGAGSSWCGNKVREDAGIWSTTTNDKIIENIIKLIQSDEVPYFQTALPRGARVLKEGAVSFKGNWETTTVNKINSRKKPALAKCVDAKKVENLLKPKLQEVEQRLPMGIPDLKTATEGAHNCTMLSDVFSFIALVNLAMEDKRYSRYFAQRTIGYNENSSATVDGKAPTLSRPDGDKSGEKRTFRCIHFYDDPGGYTLTDYIQDTDAQEGVVKILYDDFLQFLDENPDTEFKNKVIQFFDEYYIERLSDNFLNDIDDELLFVLLDDMNVARVPRD